MKVGSFIFFILPSCRIYFYSLLEKSFRLIETIDYHKRCVLVVKHVICHVTQLPSHVTQLSSHMITIPILCTCATDGDIALWNLESVITNEYRCHGDLIDSREPLEPLHVIKGAHQSGINDIAILATPTTGHASLLVIASVGEDNALAVHSCLVELVSDGGGMTAAVTCTVSGSVVVSDAHHSIITGILFILCWESFDYTSVLLFIIWLVVYVICMCIYNIMYIIIILQ